MAAAIASIRRPERHKRLMLLASFSIMQAAVVRVIRLVPSITLADRIFLGAIGVPTQFWRDVTQRLAMLGA